MNDSWAPGEFDLIRQRISEAISEVDIAFEKGCEQTDDRVAIRDMIAERARARVKHRDSLAFVEAWSNEPNSETRQLIDAQVDAIGEHAIAIRVIGLEGAREWPESD